MVRILVGCLVFASGGCGEEPCTAGESRCSGNTVEVCSAHKRWRVLADCGELSRLARRPLICAFVDGGTGGPPAGDTCIPQPVSY
jgi:hypothetical protein